jgi:4-amino-4-deoxy-L-arabinose transferase-like glycosyltransferase
MNKIHGKKIWLLLIAVAVIWFSNLEYRKLIKPDEGRYAEIPREMVASGDWVTPRLNDLKYFEKPPLQYWTTAIAYTVLGEHQWTSRLWTGLTGFAGILLVWFAGSRLFGREAADYAAMLLGGSFLYAAMGHLNTLDMGVTFFLMLGIVSLLFGQNDLDKKKQRNWMILSWAALGLAVLSKGLMGLVLPGAAMFFYIVAQRDLSVLKRMHWLPGLAVFFIITAPWFYLVMKANPEFFHFFFIHEHFERFATKVHDRYQPWYFFIPIMLVGMLPWTLVMFDTLLRSWKNGARAVNVFSPVRFLFVWSVFIFVFFSISDSKLPSYVLPIFPALALLMGKQLVETDARKLFWLVAPILPLTLLGLGLAPFTAKLADTPLQVQVYGEYSSWLIAASLVLTSGVVIALVLLRRSQVGRETKPVAILALSLSFLIAVLLATSGYNTIAKERSAYLVADAIRPYVKPSAPIYSVGDYEQTLPFYLKRTFTLVQYQDEMAFGIMQEPQRWIPDIASFAKVWQAQPAALAIVPVTYYPQLKQLNFDMKIIYEDSQRVVVTKP